MNDAKSIHVAVGVITDIKQRILIAKRPRHVHQGGLWEFPGGKLEAGETVQQALHRELYEELGIKTKCCEPLITIQHHYPDKSVVLDVWTIASFTGHATGCEGQDIRWVNQAELSNYTFPAANVPIVKAIQLPKLYAIVDGINAEQIKARLQKVLESGIALVQLRLKTMQPPPAQSFINELIRQCQQSAAGLMLNSAWRHTIPTQGIGLHLSSADMMHLTERPAGYERVSASCHNQQELAQAAALALDFAVLAPVLPTASHPDSSPLGWEQATRLLKSSLLPTYVLGGLGKSDLPQAMFCGAQGIAGIRCFVEE